MFAGALRRPGLLCAAWGGGGCTSKASPCLGYCRATGLAKVTQGCRSHRRASEGRRDGLGCLPVLCAGQGGCSRPGVEVDAPVKPLLVLGAAERLTGLAKLTQGCHSHRRASESLRDSLGCLQVLCAGQGGCARPGVEPGCTGKASMCLGCCRATNRARNSHPGLPEPHEGP